MHASAPAESHMSVIGGGGCLYQLPCEISNACVWLGIWETVRKASVGTVTLWCCWLLTKGFPLPPPLPPHPTFPNSWDTGTACFSALNSRLTHIQLASHIHRFCLQRFNQPWIGNILGEEILSLSTYIIFFILLIIPWITQYSQYLHTKFTLC